MLASILLLAGSVAVVFAFKLLAGLRRNIAAAKETELPYVVARKFRWLNQGEGDGIGLTWRPAICPWNPYWQATHMLWMPLIKLLPRSWWEPWLE